MAYHPNTGSIWGTGKYSSRGKKACILKPSLTSIIRRLTAIDLVIRRRGDTDQGFIFIHWIQDGEEVLKKMSIEMEKIYQKIGNEKIEKLLELLKYVQN